MTKWPAMLAALIVTSPAVSVGAENAPLEQLDEVVISNVRLNERIIALEDKFYQLYNELNKADQFDMYCTEIPVRRDSTETTRACLPEFYADAYSDSIEWYYRCQRMSSSGFGGTGCYTPPDPTFVLFARHKDLTKHMLGVINSDPRLQQMNRERTALEIELRALQASYAQSKQQERDENGETRAERLERLRCARPAPARTNKKSC